MVLLPVTKDSSTIDLAVPSAQRDDFASAPGRHTVADQPQNRNDQTVVGPMECRREACRGEGLRLRRRWGGRESVRARSLLLALKDL